MTRLSLFANASLLGFATLTLASTASTALTGCSRDNIEAVNLANEGDKVKDTAPDDAVQKYEQASKLDPSNHHILWKLALAYHRKGDWQKDAATCAQAEKVAPSYASYFFEHGYALMQQAKAGPTSWSEAKQPLQDAISKDPNMSQAYDALGDVELHSDDEKGALDNYTKAIELKPDESRYYGSLAALYIQLNFLDQAEQVLKEGISFLQPGDKHTFELHTYLGDVEDMKGNKAGSLSEFEAARKACDATRCAGPGEAIAFFNLGVAYATAEPPRKTEAIAQLTNFNKVCKTAAKAKIEDQCATATQIATKLGAALQ